MNTLKLPAQLLAAVIVVAAMIYGLTMLTTPAPAVLTIGLSVSEQAAVEALLASFATQKDSIKYPVKPVESWEAVHTLLQSKPAPALIVFKAGSNNRQNMPPMQALPEVFTRMISSSLLRWGSKDDAFQWLPLAIDHYELTWNKPQLHVRLNTSPGDLLQLEKALKDLPFKGASPLLIAGGNDQEFSRFMASMIIAMGGVPAYEKLIAEIGTNQTLSNLIDIDLQLASRKPFSLRAVILQLSAWKKAGYLHPDWYDMKPADLKVFVEGSIGYFITQSLSLRRDIASNSLIHYESGIFPGNQGRTALVAPILAAALPANTPASETITALLTFAMSQAGQDILTRTSGLAPASSSATAADKQASDVRNWASQNQNLYAGLAEDSCGTTQKASAMLEELRILIRQNR